MAKGKQKMNRTRSTGIENADDLAAAEAAARLLGNLGRTRRAKSSDEFAADRRAASKKKKRNKAARAARRRNRATRRARGR